MKCPRKVKIGPVTYRIQFAKNSLAGDHLIGTTDHKSLTITVDSVVALGAARATLWHEVQHAVFMAMIGQPELVPPEPLNEREEWLIRLTSDAVLTVIRENPKLMAWLSEDD